MMLFPHRRKAILDDVETLFAEQIEITDQMSSRPADAIVIEGYATRWGLRDLEGETLKRGVFTDSLHLSQHAHGVFMLRQHDERTWPIGRWSTIREDATGLWCRGAIYPKFCQGVFPSQVRSREVRELSVGYYPTVVTRHLGGRTITKAWLTEISVGSNPVLVGSTFQVVNG